jgi:hypothetical protein
MMARVRHAKALGVRHVPVSLSSESPRHAKSDARTHRTPKHFVQNDTWIIDALR